MIPNQIPAGERYKLLTPLGEGGQGKVCKAFDLQLQRFVAVKLISKGREDHSDDVLFKEALTLANLRHPNIVPVFDVVQSEEGVLVVMELLEGEDLSEWLEGEKLSLDDVHQLGSQLLEALLAAHEMKLLHRDLKPENVRVSRLPGGRLQVRVLDFGLARYSANNRRQEARNGTVTGTIFYMSPEQLEHEPMDARSDLYALACVIYQVLSGRMPFNGETVQEVIAAHLAHDVKPLRECNPDLPEALCDWVMWTMNRNPKDRPANARVALEYFNNVFDSIRADQQINRAIESGRVIGTISNPVPVTTPVAAAVPASIAAASAKVPLPGTTTGVVPSQPKAATAGGEPPAHTAKRKLPIVPIAAGVAGLLVVVGLIAVFSGGDPKPGAAPQPGGKEQAAQPPAAPKADPQKTPAPAPVVRPAPPLEGRLVARYIASDQVLGFKDDSPTDSEAAPGMAVTVWNDLVAAGGAQPLKAKDRVAAHCPVLTRTTGEDLRSDLPVVTFGQGQFLQTSFPLQSQDHVNLDPSSGGGARAGHTIVMVVRPHEIKRENRVLTLRNMTLPQGKRPVYQMLCRYDRTLRFQVSPTGESFVGCNLEAPLPVGRFLIITAVVCQADQKIRLRCRGAGADSLQSGTADFSGPVPVLDDLFIGGNASAGSGGFSPDFYGDVAELMVYRSALEESLVLDLENQLSTHYFKK